MSLASDFRIKLQASVHTDASAALAVTPRQGLGKLRHIAAHWQWVQEQAKQGNINMKKVNGMEYLADLFAKHLPIDEVNEHL